jgi:DNA-binding IscR family transcriptional regulator
MFMLNKRIDYAQIAVKHLALDRDRPWSPNNIGETQGLRTVLLARRFLRLVRNGLRTPQHGTNSGYILAQHPMSDTALEVVRTIDGLPFITSCVTALGELAQSSKCPAWEPIRKINEGIEQTLGMLMIPRLCEESPHLVQSGGLMQ